MLVVACLLLKKIKNCLYTLLQLHNCLICQIDYATKFGICKFCNSILPWAKVNIYKCHKCHKALYKSNQSICYDCAIFNNYFNKFFTIFYYRQPIKKMLFELKFNKKLFYADFFGEILCQLIFNNWYKHQPLPEVVIPMPLHYKKLRSRGFNQVLELTRRISSKITIDYTSCVRIKNTASQNNLSKAERNINVATAFAAKKLPYHHLAILDDVVTTGNTIINLSKAIIKSNPNIIIDLWCIARS